MSSFDALRVPDYRRLLVALTAAELGLYAFETALFWTVLDETGSAVHVSLLFSAIVAPILVLTVPIGILVDRIGPRRPLLWSSAAAALVVGAAGVLAASSGLSFEAAFALSVAEGIFFGCFAIPAQVVASRVVDARILPSAVGLSALPSGIGAIAGGAAGGLTLDLAGPAPTFFLAAIGLGLAVVAILGLPSLPGLESAVRPMALGELRDAVRWIRRSPIGFAIVALGAAAGFLVMSRFALLPSVARDVLDAGPTGLGLLTAAAGVGTLVGAVATNPVGRRLRRGRTMLLALATAGAGLAGLGALPVLWVACVLAGIVALAALVHQLTGATLLQVLAPPRMRGRVLALHEVVRVGLLPPGSVLATALVADVGVAGVLLAFGGLTVAAVTAAIVTCRPLVAFVMDEGSGAPFATASSAERP
ncbi:MAG TPA: MFS transporter [Candidatus Limnocylindrales bacterium]|jgi:MFS family permease|nr:MFS transporter [Candidatus Limnocylindrales bacterium]